MIDPDVVRQLLRYAGAIGEHEPRIIHDLARWEIERLTDFLKEIGAGGEVLYDGPEHGWLLGLTAVSRRSIDAVNLDLSNGLQEAFGLGAGTTAHRYLQLQRDAIAERGTRVRRIFVLDDAGVADDPDVVTVLDDQREAGVLVRLLDESSVAEELKSLVFDFVVFDESVSYEVTPSLRVVAGTRRPSVVRTHLAMTRPQLHDRMRRFEQLWDAATPLPREPT